MANETTPEKLSEPLMVRVTPSMLGRVEAVCARKHLKPPDLGRQGLAIILEQYESETPAIDAETAALCVQAKAMGLDLGAMIKAELSKAA